MKKMKAYRIVLLAATVCAVGLVCLLQVGCGRSLQTTYIEAAKEWALANGAQESGLVATAKADEKAPAGVSAVQPVYLSQDRGTAGVSGR